MSPKAAEDQALVVYMPNDLHAQLKKRARAEDRSMSQVVRLLVREYVKGEKP